MKINCAIASKTTLLVGSLLALGMPAFGLPIFGILGFGGEKLFSFTLPSGTNIGSYIDFQNPVDGGTGAITAAGRTGDFFVGPVSVPFGLSGTIRDLSSAPIPLPGYAIAPVGPLGTFPLPINNFLSFPVGGLATTNIRLLALPNATNCSVSITCIGAFQLLQSGPDVSVTLGLIGDLINGPDMTPYTGTITAQFSNTTVAAVVAAASSPGGVTSFSWSGQISSVPEPGTVTLLGMGLFAMLLGGLRAKRRSNY